MNATQPCGLIDCQHASFSCNVAATWLGLMMSAREGWKKLYSTGWKQQHSSKMYSLFMALLHNLFLIYSIRGETTLKLWINVSQWCIQKHPSLITLGRGYIEIVVVNQCFGPLPRCFWQKKCVHFCNWLSLSLLFINSMFETNFYEA